MLLTEPEAATKWCPHARVAIDTFPNAEMIHVASVNRGDFGIVRDFCKCQASACSQWRWRDPEKQLIPGSVYDENSPGMIKRIEPVNDRRGYCGLAGIPDERTTTRS